MFDTSVRDAHLCFSPSLMFPLNCTRLRVPASCDVHLSLSVVKVVVWRCHASDEAFGSWFEDSAGSVGQLCADVPAVWTQLGDGARALWFSLRLLWPAQTGCELAASHLRQQPAGFTRIDLLLFRGKREKARGGNLASGQATLAHKICHRVASSTGAEGIHAACGSSASAPGLQWQTQSCVHPLTANKNQFRCFTQQWEGRRSGWPFTPPLRVVIILITFSWW